MYCTVVYIFLYEKNLKLVNGTVVLNKHGCYSRDGVHHSSPTIVLLLYPLTRCSFGWFIASARHSDPSLKRKHIYYYYPHTEISIYITHGRISHTSPFVFRNVLFATTTNGNNELLSRHDTCHQISFLLLRFQILDCCIP